MKIYMLSNIDRTGLNRKLYKEFLSNCDSVAYIPSWTSKESEKDFNAFKKSIQKECKNVNFIPVDKKMSKKHKENLKKANVIFIDGGNTFFLMKNLRKNGYFGLLKKMKNKTFVGVSAGAIALTPSIDLAKIPTFTADENAVGLTNLKGLGFVNFHFHPHATNNKKELKQLKEYSSKHGETIYLCKDGQAVMVKKDKVMRSGKVQKMKTGKTSKTESMSMGGSTL